eukprot:9366241-Alexandrium_andersonii.AAC.1
MPMSVRSTNTGNTPQGLELPAGRRRRSARYLASSGKPPKGVLVQPRNAHDNVEHHALYATNDGGKLGKMAVKPGKDRIPTRSPLQHGSGQPVGTLISKPLLLR